MWWMLIWIIGCYAFAAFSVRLAGHLCPGLRNGTHYVLYADNQGDRMEWYLRRLYRWSRRTGKDLRITVVDCRSTDDTVAIAERFSRRDGAVTVIGPFEKAKHPAVISSSAGKGGCTDLSASVGVLGKAVYIDLSDPADVAMLP